MKNADYFIKRPNAKSGTKSYKIVRRIILPDGRAKNETISNESLDTLNKQFRTGAIAPDVMEGQLRSLVLRLRGEDAGAGVKTYTSPENLKILKRFFEDVYGSRMLADKEGAYNDFRRAVEALGQISLYNADQKQVQTHLNNSVLDKAKHNRVCSRLVTIFRYLGKTIELQGAREPRTRPTHLKLVEFRRVLRELPKEYCLMYRAAFFTGARVGELCALNEDDLRGRASIYIDKQLIWNRKTKLVEMKYEPKWGSSRSAFIPPLGRKCVLAWCRLPAEEKIRLFRIQHRHIIKKECMKLFPGRADKHCTIHDLRHSYAIYLGVHNVPLERIAKFLGDTLQTAERYYAGLLPSDDDIQATELRF